jgi:hypothetical protein
MPTVEVTPKDESGNRFSVEVRDEDGSATTHEVTVDNSDWERLGSGYASRAEVPQQPLQDPISNLPCAGTLCGP